MERQADAIRRAGRARDAERPGDDRADPVGTDDDAGLEIGLAAASRTTTGRRSTPVTGRAEPDVRSRAAGEGEQRRVERRPVEPDRRGVERPSSP